MPVGKQHTKEQTTSKIATANKEAKESLVIAVRQNNNNKSTHST